MKFPLLLFWVVAQVWGEQRTVDLVTPVAPKDATVYRFNLRHALKHILNLRNVYVVSRPTDQMKAIVAHANAKYTTGNQEVILVDEGVFPFTFDTIRAYLRENRPDEGFDGKPFDGVVVVPDLCKVGGPKQGNKDWVHKCRQPFANETTSQGREVITQRGKEKLQTFDRTGWMLQQFLKLGVTPEFVPGIGDAYMVIDADTIFYEDYSPVPPDSDTAFNYMPGDNRDCSNPPYFMTLDAMQIKTWSTKVRACAGRGSNRRCKAGAFCPIAHGMVYSRAVLKSFHEHLESFVTDIHGNKVQWWQAVLQLMPTWHCSPFSEYITYYAYALQNFPETVHVYDAEQMGASEEEIPANYYMGNGLGVSNRCDLVGFAASPKAKRSSHPAAEGYCKNPGKRADSCETYDKSKHGGKPCPAPKYEAYHGFRNAISPAIDKVFLDYDLSYAKEHAADIANVKVIGSGVGKAKGGSAGGAAGTSGENRVEVRESALSALDATIGGKRKGRE